MPDLTRFKPLLKPLKIVFLVFGIIFLLTFVPYRLYASRFLHENVKVEAFRLQLDNMFSQAFLDNNFGFQKIQKLFNPEVYLWRPPRILIDPYEDSAYRYGIYAEVIAWAPEYNELDVWTYLPGGPDEVYFSVDPAKDTTIIIPQFDHANNNAAYFERELDTSFVTQEELLAYANSFDSTDDLIVFNSTFETDEELMEYIAETYGEPPVPYVQKEDVGPYIWETAFCEGDIIFISFENLDKFLKSEKTEEVIEANLVSVEVGSCPVIYE